MTVPSRPDRWGRIPRSVTVVADTFPRQYARTQRLTLGDPRDVSVSSDGRRIVFLRSRAGDDPVNCLWVADADTGEERLVADPRDLAGDHPAIDDDLPAEERARRERARESASASRRTPLTRRARWPRSPSAGRLFVGGPRQRSRATARRRRTGVRPAARSAGARVAYVSGRLLCIAELDGSWWVLAGGDLDEPETVTWGSADFIAAEEMNRFRGYWWSPDGDAIAVCRVDTAPVQRWYIGDPADPSPPSRRRSRTRPPAPTTPTSACTCSRSTAASRSTWSGTGMRSRTSPTSTGRLPG